MPEHSAAPGDLEDVRSLVNTWRVPNDTRAPVDELPALRADAGAWRRAFAVLPPPLPTVDIAAVRDDVRSVLGLRHPVQLAGRVDAVAWRPVIADTGEPAVRWRPVDEHDTAATVLALVLAAVGDGTWHRLRACPDCGWAFYDSSRNARRTWCSMGAGAGARGCGSIAKTRAYRARRRGDSGGSSRGAPQTPRDFR